MKKLYIFGDSFSLFNDGIKEAYSDLIEFNTHSSLSNDHILKLAKLKILKLIKNGIKDVNLFLQLTIPNRLLILNNSNSGYTKSELKNFVYSQSQLLYSDKDLFENGVYFSLYPYFQSENNILIDSIYAPYSKLIHSKNEKLLLKDWILEINILHLLCKSNGINLEYAYYPNDYDEILKFNRINSLHIQIEGFNSIESYINSQHPYFFTSKTDIHLNDDGCRWYINFLKQRYGI